MYIRNFAIIAHVDHGKSTLADRIIEHLGGLEKREMSSQVLDSMELERERGITIKSQAVSLNYKADDGHDYQFNIIDTPGHVDFSYEVSRSLSACEGVILLVDCSQGVEAQTVANCFAALEQGNEIIPVLNKIDLPQAEPERVISEIEDIIGLDCSNVLTVSGKTGKGVPELLKAITSLIPAPNNNSALPLRALIIDAWFDPYLGVITLVKVVDGEINKGDKLFVQSNQNVYNCDNLGVFTPKKQFLTKLSTGQVGFIISNVKQIQGVPVGDTITHASSSKKLEALPGFKPSQPKVYAGLYPIDSSDFENFRDSLQKLSLNDASLSFEPESSDAIGHGFRCGFLGLLHMEVIQERLEREYNLDLITTAPTVIYELESPNGEKTFIGNPEQFPVGKTNYIVREPIIEANIMVPDQFVGPVINLCINKRGVQKNMQHFGKQVNLVYELPLNEVVLDFFDKLKSVSKGYASVDYNISKFTETDLVKLDILINGEAVDALASIVHRSKSLPHGRELVEKLKELIPRQMYDVAIQAAIGGKFIARSTVKALRKNVTAKCYGGDVSRKRKLLEKQKAGKKRMKQIGKIDVPQSAFLAVLKIGSEQKK